MVLGMKQPEVYNYSEPQSFLRDTLGYKCAKNPSFSVRAWARQMGLKAHASLVFLLNGRRQIRLQHLPFLIKGLNLDEPQAKYFSDLVHFHNSKTCREQEFYERQLKAQHPSHEFSFVDLEKFRSIANWYHMAILEMTELADFENDPHWICERLENKLTVYQVHEAVERLLNLGLLKLEDGRLAKTEAHFMTPKNRTSESIKEHHKQILELAITAADQQDLDERYYNSCAMTIDSSKIKEATELILEFRTRFASLIEKPKGNETYQLSVQFFRLTNQNKGEKP